MTLTLSLLLWMLGIISTLSTSDTEWKTSTCASDFSCAASESLRDSDPKCRCDADCIHYGECCDDAPAYDRSQQMQNVRKQQCIFGIRMFSKCSDNWKNSNMERLCETHSPLDLKESEEPIMHIPVTSKVTNFTYTNYFCALCNNDAENITVWQSEMQCFFSVDNKTVETNLNILRKYLHLHSGIKDYKIKEHAEKQRSNRIMNRDKILQYIKSNIKISKENGKWLLADPLNDTKIFMTCSLKLTQVIRHLTLQFCMPSINTCGANWTDKETESLCLSTRAPVQYSSNYSAIFNIGGKTYATSDYEIVIYRNTYCAKCNNINIENPCIEIFPTTGIRFKPSPIPPLSIVLQTPDFIQRQNFNESGICKEQGLYISIYEKCDTFLCQITSKRYKNGLCIQRHKTSRSSLTYEKTIDTNDTHGKDIFKITNTLAKYETSNNKSMANPDSIHLSSMESNLVLASQNLSCENYIYIQTKDFMNKSGIITTLDLHYSYNPGTYQATEGGVLVCPSHPKYFDILGWLTFVGLVISILSLSLHLVAFALVKQLRNLPGMNLATLCVCLLGGYCSFIAGALLKPKSTACYTTASITYFCFFASFCWMSIIAFDTCVNVMTFKPVFNIFRDKMQLYVKYSLCSWILSITALAFVVTIDILKPSGIASDLLPKIGEKWCWFGQNKASLVFFVIPMVLSSKITTVLFLGTTIYIKKQTNETISSVNNKFKINLLRVNLRLAISMGITWATGAIALCVQHNVTWCIFIIFNTLHGAFIFFAFTCQKRVRDEIIKSYLIWKKERKEDIYVCRNIPLEEYGVQHIAEHFKKCHQPNKVNTVYTVSTSL